MHNMMTNHPQPVRIEGENRYYQCRYTLSFLKKFQCNARSVLHCNFIFPGYLDFVIFGTCI